MSTFSNWIKKLFEPISRLFGYKVRKEPKDPKEPKEPNEPKPI